MQKKIIYTCIVYLFAQNLCFAKDYYFSPYINVQQLYSDNILLDDSDKQAEFATTLMPGLYATRNGNRLKARFNYALEQIFVTGNVNDNTVHNLRTDAVGELYKDHLFLDASVNNGQQNVQATDSVSADNVNDFGARENVFYYRLNPYWKQNISNLAKMTIGHTYDEVLTNVGDSNSNLSYINITNGTRIQKLKFNFQATHRSVEFDNATVDEPSFTSIQNRFIYPVTRQFSATATIGYDSDDIAGVSDTSGPMWNLGFIWRPSRRTNIDFSAGERYFGSDFQVDAAYATSKTELRMTYQIRRETARDFLTQTQSDIFFDRGASGLLDINGNIVDDRTFDSPSVLDAAGFDQNNQTALNSELRFTAAYNLRRNNYALGFFFDENEFQQENTNIESFGVDLAWQSRISRTITSNLNVVYLIRDLETGIETRDSIIDFAVVKDLSPDFAVTFGYRFSAFEADDANFGEFNENRVLIGISKEF